MKTRALILTLTLALLLVLAGVVLANGPPPRQALSSGATDAHATGLTLRATLGQPFIGLLTTSGGADDDITLGQGLWHGGSIPTPTNSPSTNPVLKIA